MKIKNFTYSICNFLDHETDRVLLVKGAWGIGKTYCIESILNENQEHYKFIRVSLFGISNIHDLSRVVSENLVNKFIHQNTNQAVKMVLSVPFISNFIPKQVPTIDQIKIGDSFSKFVVFFDDIERTSIRMQEFFGYVDRMKSSSGFKIIIAMNDNRIKDNEIREIKEKVTDKELRLTDTLEYVIDDIFKQDAEFALGIFKNLKIVNIRVIIKSYQVMSQILSMTHNLNTENLSRLKASCLCLSAKYFSSEDVDESILKSISQFDAGFIFNSIINAYLDSQIVNKDLIARHNNYLVKSQVDNNNNEMFKKIVSLFEMTFQDNSKEIISLSNEFIRQPSLNERQLVYIINLLISLDQKIPLEELIDIWIYDKENYSAWFINELMDMFKDSSSHNILGKYLHREKEHVTEDNSSNKNNSYLIHLYLSQCIMSKFYFFEDELSAFSRDDWLDFVNDTATMDIFIKLQGDILDFISNEKGSYLKQALKHMMSIPIQKLRLVRIFGKDIEKME